MKKYIFFILMLLIFMNGCFSGNKEYCSKLDEARSYREVWKIVKTTVKDSLGETRGGMMLFLDDLSLNLGAYHPVGTNNIVLNRRLLEIIKATIKSKQQIKLILDMF